MQKHSSKTTKRKRYITYAESPEMVAAAQERVLRAMSEILHNPETPSGLYEAVADFACAQSNECGDEFYHSNDYLTVILNTVHPGERRGAIIAAREPLGGAA